MTTNTTREALDNLWREYDKEVAAITKRDGVLWGQTPNMARLRLRIESTALASDAGAVQQTEREAFELWLTENRYDKGAVPGGAYHSPFTRNAWLAWQARAALSAAPVAGVPADHSVDANKMVEPAAFLNYARKKPNLRTVSFTALPEKRMQSNGWIAVPLYEHPAAPSPVVREPLTDRVAEAYAYLWLVNNEPGTPHQYPPERAAYEARKILRDMLTMEQRGNAINAVLARVSGIAPTAGNTGE